MSLSLNVYKRIKDLTSKTTLVDADVLVTDNASDNTSKKITFANFCTQLLTKLKLGVITTGHYLEGNSVAEDLSNLDGQIYENESAISGKIDDISYSNAGVLTKTVGSDSSNVMSTDSVPTDSSVNPVQSGGVYTALSDKVDKVDGKGLSTEDYTTNEKTKLDGIESGAEVNVQPDWSQTDNSEDDYIKNKPTLGTAATKNYTAAVTDGSQNLITSGGVYSEMTGNNSNYGKYHLELYIDSDGDICQL